MFMLVVPSQFLFSEMRFSFYSLLWCLISIPRCDVSFLFFVSGGHWGDQGLYSSPFAVLWLLFMAVFFALLYIFLSDMNHILISYTLLAVKQHLLFSPLDLFSTSESSSGNCCSQGSPALLECPPSPWAGAQQGSSTGSAVSTSWEQLHEICRDTNVTRESLSSPKVGTAGFSFPCGWACLCF